MPARGNGAKSASECTWCGTSRGHATWCPNAGQMSYPVPRKTLVTVDELASSLAGEDYIEALHDRYCPYGASCSRISCFHYEFATEAWRQFAPLYESEKRLHRLWRTTHQNDVNYIMALVAALQRAEGFIADLARLHGRQAPDSLLKDMRAAIGQAKGAVSPDEGESEEGDR